MLRVLGTVDGELGQILIFIPVWFAERTQGAKHIGQDQIDAIYFAVCVWVMSGREPQVDT